MSDPLSAASVYVPQSPSGDETRRRLAGKSPTEVAKEFEAVLLAQVISAMRKTVPDSGLLEASANRKMLDGAFDQEVARSLAAKGGLGIAEQIVGQIERQQAARDAAAGTTSPTMANGSTAGVLGRTAASGRLASLGSTSGVSSLASTAHARASSSARASAQSGAQFPRIPSMAESQSPAPPVGSEVTALPVAGAISSPFGIRSDPFTGEARFHAGVDVAAPRGSAIRSVADGEVVYSGWRRGGAGRVVEVRHADGLVTSYAHAEKTLVRAGQHVGAGDAIATVGSSGRSSGPHLHFAATRDGQAIDPTGLLEGHQTVAAGPTQPRGTI